MKNITFGASLIRPGMVVIRINEKNVAGAALATAEAAWEQRMAEWKAAIEGQCEAVQTGVKHLYEEAVQS